MTDQPALRLVTSSDFAKQLLSSAQHDEPAAGAMQRALSGLGFAPVGLLAASAMVAASKSAAAAPVVAGVSSAAQVSLVAAAKWVAVGLFGALLGLGAVDLALSPRPAPAPTLPVRASQPAADMTATESAAARVLPPASVEPEAPLHRARALSPVPSEREPERALVPVEPAPATAAFEASSAGTDGLAQLAELSKVRRALARHDNARALALLGEFDARHPASRLAEEALVLRIEALQGAGRGTESRALGVGFLQRHPHSVYAARVRSALEIP